MQTSEIGVRNFFIIIMPFGLSIMSMLTFLHYGRKKVNLFYLLSYRSVSINAK